MHFNTAASLALALASTAAGLSIPKAPASGVCPNKQYWDTGKGCTPLPPPKRCYYGGYYDTVKGCVSGSPPNGPPKPFCTIVKGLISAAHETAQATAFCSSYLHVPLSTSTSTVTSYTTTVTIHSTITSGQFTTTHATETVTETDTATETDSATVTDYTTTVSTISTVSTTYITACASPTAPAKRSVKGPSKPGCLGKYQAGQALSSACKCLSIKPSTTTKKTTLRTPTTTVVSVTVPHTDDVTATATATLVETETMTNTETDVSTVTNYETIYTSTTAVVAIPTFKVYAIGGDNNGHPFYDIGDGRVGDDAENGVTVLEFSINSDGTLTADNGSKSGSEGETDPNAGGTDSYVMFGSSGNNLVNVVCNVLYNDDGTCPLACQGSRGTTNYDCGVYWRIGSNADVGNCFQFIPYVVGSQ
ncbi:hypothetical protein BKA56DRAFT_687986 [Ilyonectria sp. MPI-CAGE-AT-0026]|nr:hypothetical protein BKA56DRAFT_687986 [Ilyonectria sp. MPI-CAGE-AT-0026]